MEAPTVVRQTKDYLLIKVPLPKRGALAYTGTQKTGKMSVAEKRLWRIIQRGEREHREGKTIRARTSEEALRIYAQQKNR